MYTRQCVKPTAIQANASDTANLTSQLHDESMDKKSIMIINFNNSLVGKCMQ